MEQAPADAQQYLIRRFLTGCRANMKANHHGRSPYRWYTVHDCYIVIWPLSPGCVFHAVSGAAFCLEHAVGTVLIEDGLRVPRSDFETNLPSLRANSPWPLKTPMVRRLLNSYFPWGRWRP